MALEEAGVPSVAVHTHVFARLAQSTARAAGMPRTRQAYVPQPVVDKTPDELRGYIEGTDPITKRPFMQEVIEGLTKPLDEEDLKGLTFERSTPRLLAPDTEDNLQRAVPREQLDRLPPGHPADRRARRGDAQGHQPCARQGGRPPAPDRVPRVLGVHGREGRGQRRDGRLQAGIPAGHPRAWRERHDRALVEHDLVRDDRRSSTARSATRSA